MENRDALLSLALKAAVAAGEEILAVYGREFEVERKDDRSPLTEADRRAHRCIADILGPSKLPVLSEEGMAVPFDERRDWPSFWLVDPLDGTKEFIKRNGEFTVNIALVEGRRSVLGVIYAPVPDTIYFGGRGIGAFKLEGIRNFPADAKTGDELSVLWAKKADRLPLAPASVPRKFTVAASRSHGSPETESYIEALRREHGDLEIVSSGSSLKICRVAEGAADVYPRFAPTMEWDTAAGQAIVEAAGAAIVSADDHSPLEYNKPDLINPWFVVIRQ
jgi:3'(2'), 5'-bisphosphate nucleotidase